ncbi:MAG: hypothetical protein CMG71_07245 [Candidatus Marinimicrobia bacterium]|nr:hypothetical protein [Candidatus Neomarinimicrobiota bacterium]|tara:strand:+ start:292 stop:900 length:609 start_codon:yes stop_codon:yes gene_type:complete
MIIQTYQETDEPNRAVLGLHGWMGDEFSMEPIAKSVSADSAKWYMPRAPYDADKGVGYTWFSGSDEAGWKYEKTVEMMPTVLGNIAADGFLLDHTFIVGFSMGAGLAILTGCRLPYAIGGIVTIAGFVKNPDHLTAHMTEASLATPILMMHGTRDELVTPEIAKETVDLLKGLGYSVRFDTYDAGHRIPKMKMPTIREFLES